ncbi:Vgb family protein [Salinifilum ghardaiensis]
MRVDPTRGSAHPRDERWRAARLTGTSPLQGSNGVAFGPDGRLHVAEYLAGRISAVDLPSGEVEVVVDGPVQSPDDLAFGTDGSMYIADLTPGRVWRRSPDGEFALVAEVPVPNGITCLGDRLFVNEMRMGGRVLELFPGGGDPVVLAEGLAMGNAMQFGPDGYVYYPHMLTGEVHRVAPDGGGAELVAEGVHAPVAVRFDRSGVLTVLSRGQEGIVTRIDLFGSGARTVGATELSGMDNAAFDADNRMFVSSFAEGGIAELAPDGRARRIVPTGFCGPYGVAVDSSGAVFAGDNYRLAEVEGAAARTRELLVLSHGVVADDRGRVHLTSQYGAVSSYEPDRRELTRRAAELDQPMGLAARSDGALVVAEAGAGRVVTIDEDDVLDVLVGGLDAPVDVAVDAEDRCHVCDERRGAVARVDDGALVPLAEGLDRPQGIAVHGGELFVVEVGRRRLLAIDLGSGASTVEAEELGVGPPAGTSRAQPALFNHGLPGVPAPFAGVAVGGDGALYVSASDAGTVLRLQRSGRAPA